MSRSLASVAVLGLALAAQAPAQPIEPVLSLAKKERQPLLDTLKELVSIETGSRDLEGLDRAASLICRDSARTRTTPSTSCSARSSRACTCSRA